MACLVLPPRSVHPLATILLPHNGLLVGGKKLPRKPSWKERDRGESQRGGEIKRWRESAKEMEKAISSRASELSYSCYDLSSLKSFSLSSFSFLVSTPFPCTLRALGRFYLSNEPLILLFFLSLPHSFWMEGNICHAVKPVFASNLCVRACVCTWIVAELSGVKCLRHSFGWRWW